MLLHKHLELFMNHGQLEAKSMCAIFQVIFANIAICMKITTLQILYLFQDNAVLCNEVNEKVVQHFVQCIESHGKHVQVFLDPICL